MAMCGKKFACSSQPLSSVSSRIFSFSWGFPFLVQKSFKSSGRRPKKKIYYREHDLDRVMELQKKPSLILQLKNIILNQKNRCILLSDLEKEVGIVEKWNFMSIIERYPLIFKVTGGTRRPYVLQLTDKALSIIEQQKDVMEMMEPIVVTNLRKLLMMSMDCRIPLVKLVLIQPELGLPKNFMEDLIPKYPDFFSVQEFKGHDYLQLESWDSSLAVTHREYNLVMDPMNGKRLHFTTDGNCSCPFSFKVKFPAGFRPNMRYLEEFHKWQKLVFPSPYLNARQFNPASPAARKRAVAVLHELLSLTVEKRLTSAQLDAFHAEYQLPCRLLLCLVRNHGIFYLTNKGIRSTVMLKEAYDGSCLIEKSPLVRFNDKFLSLAVLASGRLVSWCKLEFSPWKQNKDEEDHMSAIREGISWHRLAELQPAGNDVISRGSNVLKQFMVAPFLMPLKAWMSAHYPTGQKFDVSVKGATCWKAKASSTGRMSDAILSITGVYEHTNAQLTVNSPIKIFRNFRFESGSHCKGSGSCFCQLFDGTSVTPCMCIT